MKTGKRKYIIENEIGEWSQLIKNKKQPSINTFSKIIQCSVLITHK